MANSPSGEAVTERIVRVLETFDTDRTVQTAAEIGRRAGLPSSTAHRMVADLVECGLLERDEDQRVHLGMRLWKLALRGSRALRLRQAALPFMERVQARVREHTQLAVQENVETLFIERLSGPPETGLSETGDVGEERHPGQQGAAVVLEDQCHLGGRCRYWCPWQPYVTGVWVQQYSRNAASSRCGMPREVRRAVGARRRTSRGP
ncbi:helix-turn-helix domain-containing protein [Streptomyces sp. NPDC060030]|uniref:helix-turn-helix domain-containing protein n=1 Tax=Streptomyces sp. NPDC060030 TaxID=3347042 RepID=UPI00368B3B03